MKGRRSSSTRWGLVATILAAALVAIGLVTWYQNLEESRQRALQNLVRQLPDLPGRYSI